MTVTAMCEGDFSEWLDVAEGQSVPRRIHLHFPAQEFDVDYRFEWLPERLWMLESGRSQFAGHEPQRERIVDRTVNEPLPELNEQAARVQRAAEQLHGSAVEFELRRPALQPFRLGDPTALRWNGLRGGADVTDVRFTIEPHEGRFREVPFRSTLVAEIGLAHELGDADEDGRLLLALYDAAGRPLQTAQVPLAALALARRPATELLQRIREHNALWLAPAMEALPDVRYMFYLGDDAEACRLDDEENPYYRRGITLDLGLDAFLRSPERYTAPVQFDARWRDKDVTVAVVVGPTFGCTFGNGISHGWHGYRVSTHAQAMLVVERATGRPLVSRYGDAEVYFLDYAEVQPGQYVPMRIAVRYGAGWHYDFHFQVVDGHVWLLDRSVGSEGNTVARVDGIVVEGREPARLQRGKEAVPLFELPAIDWAGLNERRILRDAENPVASAVTAEPRPFDHPWFHVFAAVDAQDRAIALDLGQSRVLQDAAYWTLSRVAAAGADGARGEAETQLPAVVAVPVQRGRELAVHVKSPDGTTQIRSVRLTQDERGELLAELEIVSEDYWRAFSAFASVVVLDGDDVAIACGDATVNFQVRDGVYRSSGIAVRLGKGSELGHAKSLVVGLHAVQSGQHIGSVWATFLDFSPIFPFEQMLANAQRDIWTYGLNALNRHLRREFRYLGQEEREEHRGRESPERELARALIPHRGSFERILEQAEEPGELSLLCRLAGYSQDPRFEGRLVDLLDHSDARVQDGAAVGLGLLGKPAGLNRIKAILARPVTKKVPAPSAERDLRIDARRALEALGQS